MEKTPWISLGERIRLSVAQPARLGFFVRRRFRNLLLRLQTRGHAAFYRAVMADDVAIKGANAAVGTASVEQWLAIGEKQFTYLVSHGLAPTHRLLELGCGNLRAGWRFIEYLPPGHYTGVDISPDILVAAQRTLVERGLQKKLPSLYLVEGTQLSFLPDEHYDVVHAHSVFSHTPLEVIKAYFTEVFRLLKPGGFFDFTYNAREGKPAGFLNEDFFYPCDFLLEVGRSHGYVAEPMSDWKYLQDKIRLTKPRS